MINDYSDTRCWAELWKKAAKSHRHFSSVWRQLYAKRTIEYNDARKTICELREMCKLTYDAIKTLPIDCLGEARDGELIWPIRDELLDKIAKAIDQAETS